MRPAALAARRTAHLEHIAKVGGEFQAQRHDQFPTPVICNRDALVQPFLPEETGAFDMDHSMRHSVGRVPAVAEVGGEKNVVLRERSSEQ